MVRLPVAAVALLLVLPACTTSPTRAARAVTTPPSPTETATPTATPTTASPTPTPDPASPPAAVARYDYAFPIAGCTTSYARAHHDYPATDLVAAKGCAFVAPVAGRVDEVAYVDRWDSATNRGADRGGLSVSVVGVDGVRYYGSHLSAVAAGIRPGTTVRAGTRLGSVGNTGSARGIATHLHFGVSWPTRAGVWWVRRGWVNPWPYLDSWRAGGDKSPAVAVRSARAAAGTAVPPCRSYC